MKKALFLSIIICVLLSLTVGAKVQTRARDVADIVVIDTLGIDPAPGGVLVTLSHTGLDGGAEGAVFSAAGSTVTEAIDNIRAFSYRGDIFLPHVNSVLLGGCVDDALDYICVSPDIIIDVPVFAVKNASANETICSCGESIGGVLSTLTRRAQDEGMLLSTAAGAADSLYSRGCAVFTALELQDSAQHADGEEGMTVGISGYALYCGGDTLTFADASQTLGISLLGGGTGTSSVTVSDKNGGDVTLDISRGSCVLQALRQDGRLEKLTAAVDVTAAATEYDPDAPPDGEWLTAQLKHQVAESVMSALLLCRELDADLFGLSGVLEKASPGDWHRTKAAAIGEIFFSVTVKAQIGHMGDVKE